MSSRDEFVDFIPSMVFMMILHQKMIYLKSMMMPHLMKPLLMLFHLTCDSKLISWMLQYIFEHCSIWY